MEFEILGQVVEVSTIAVGRSIRRLALLKKRYGAGRWRKMKGLAFVRLGDGTVRWAEIHWYECHTVGRREFKLKRFVGEGE